MSRGMTIIWLALVCGKIWSSTSTKRSAPLPTQVVTPSTPSSPRIRASTRLVTASLAANEVPSGYQRSTSTSSRLESGKNCCCTAPMPATPRTSEATVAPIVFQRWRTHQATTARKRA